VILSGVFGPAYGIQREDESAGRYTAAHGRSISPGGATLYSYVALHPVLLADGVDPGAVRGSIVRFSAVGIGLYVVTLGIAVVSAPACLVAHFVIAIYYCFQQIRPGSPAA
jgi:hypothetical protein